MSRNEKSCFLTLLLKKVRFKKKNVFSYFELFKAVVSLRKNTIFCILTKKVYLEGIPSSVEAAAAAGEAASLIDAVADRILADN